MARRLTSLAILLISAIGVAQPFGRFGYLDGAKLPGFVVDRQGFRITAADASTFQFSQPTQAWRYSQISDMDKEAMISSSGRAPRKISANLLSPGFSLYFESGLSFVVSSADCPFITWADGSAGSGVPTPPINWALISFKKAEPPVLLAFPDQKYSLRIDGGPGGWVLRSIELTPGWVHVISPLGNASAATSSARDLGALVQRVLPNLDVWIAPRPRYEDIEIHSDEQSVTATWHFDRPLAVIPSAAILAAAGGYPVKIETPVRDLGIATDEGPVQVTATPDLVVRFPVRRLAPGRSLVDGFDHVDAVVNGFNDVQGMVGVALANLEAGCDPKTRDMATKLSTRFVSQSKNYPEPITGQQLPYSSDGAGLEVASAYALLLASNLAADGRDVRVNPLNLSMLVSRDWATWKIWAADPSISRTATELTAVACVLGGDEHLRLDGAMLEAGLAADRARSRGGAPNSEILSNLRQWLFSGEAAANADTFCEALSSPVTVFADFPISARADKDGLIVSWLSQDCIPKEVVVSSASHFRVDRGKNVLTISSHNTDSGLIIRALPGDIGPTEVRLSSSSLISVPKFSPPPRSGG